MWTTLTARETYAVAVLMSVTHKETFHSKLKCHPLASLTLSLMESLAAFKQISFECEIILHARVDSFHALTIFLATLSSTVETISLSKQLEMTVLTFFIFLNSRRLHLLTFFLENKTKRQAWQKRESAATPLCCQCVGRVTW